jgi:EamA-like transporter family
MLILRLSAFAKATSVLDLGSAGLWGYALQILVTKGLELAPAARAMSLQYTAILWGEVAGMALFKEFPNLWAILGIVVVIVGTGASVQQPSSHRPMDEVPPENESGSEMLCLRAASEADRSPEGSREVAKSTASCENLS